MKAGCMQKLVKYVVKHNTVDGLLPVNCFSGNSRQPGH